MYSCWVKIFQKRDNICRWLGSTPLASAYLMIDESSTHTIKLWKALKSILLYPAFLIVPALIVSLLVSCMTTVDTNLVLPCTFSALRSAVPSIILFSAYPKEIKAALPDTGFQSFFPPTQLSFPVDSLCQVMVSKESILNFQYLTSDFLALETLRLCQPKV